MNNFLFKLFFIIYASIKQIIFILFFMWQFLYRKTFIHIQSITTTFIFHKLSLPFFILLLLLKHILYMSFIISIVIIIIFIWCLFLVEVIINLNYGYGLVGLKFWVYIWGNIEIRERILRLGIHETHFLWLGSLWFPLIGSRLLEILNVIGRVLGWWDCLSLVYRIVWLNFIQFLRRFHSMIFILFLFRSVQLYLFLFFLFFINYIKRLLTTIN